MVNIISKLEDISREESSLGLLANYLLQYDEDLANLKISAVCDELFISIASTTRLANKLGLDGFTQLKIYLAQERSSKRAQLAMFENSMSQHYYEDLIGALQGTLTTVDNKLINKIGNEIIASSKVNLFGIGSSNVVVSYLAQKLIRIQKPVSFHADSHFQYVEAMNSNSSQIAIALSFSGLTHEILANLQLSKKHGATTVLITANHNVKYDFIDYIIVVPNSDLETSFNSISNRFTSVIIFDLLYLSIIETNPTYYKGLIASNKYS